MDSSLTKIAKAASSFLTTRTGFLGLGPTYAEIIATYALAYLAQRQEERSVVREAENILAEINERNAKWF